MLPPPGSTKSPGLLLLKILPLSDHHSDFWAATLISQLFSCCLFCMGRTFFLQFGCFCVDYCFPNGLNTFLWATTACTSSVVMQPQLKDSLVLACNWSIVVIKFFTISLLPSQPFLDHHLKFHSFFHKMNGYFALVLTVTP